MVDCKSTGNGESGLQSEIVVYFSSLLEYGAPQTQSEVICEKDGTLIHSQHRRLHRWSEHFLEQFSWPESTTPFSSDNPNPEWDVDISPPTVAEITRELQLLKRNKAAGPDGLSPTLFKDGGEALTIALTRLLALIWESEVVRQNGARHLLFLFTRKVREPRAKITGALV